MAVTEHASSDELRPLRADAERNRQLILAAARRLFAARGLEATLDDVAREAGVGVATVYRRFRDKYELAEALFEEDLDALLAEAEQAAALEDPWEGFVAFVRTFVERQAIDCGLRDLVSSAALGRDHVARIRDRLRPSVERIVRRAQQAGALRADFGTYDVAVLAVMVGAASDFSRPVRPELWQRYLSVLLDGLRASSAGAAGVMPDVDPLTSGELEVAMATWRPRHR